MQPAGPQRTVDAGDYVRKISARHMEQACRRPDSVIATGGIEFAEAHHAHRPADLCFRLGRDLGDAVGRVDSKAPRHHVCGVAPAPAPQFEYVRSGRKPFEEAVQMA